MLEILKKAVTEKIVTIPSVREGAVKNMLKEFKEFAIKGNVVDLAVGIIIGAAFNGVINSLVNDIIMPPLGLLVKKVDFANLFIDLSSRHFSSLAAAKAAGVPTINYGLFINTLINFVIVAFAVFFLVKQINRLRKSPPKEADAKACPFCTKDIPLKATRCPECTAVLQS